MSTPGVKPYLWMLTGSGWFAAMVIFIDALKGACDWQTVAVTRAALATVFAVVLLLVTRLPLVFPGPPTLWLRSVSGSMSMVTTFYALTHLPPSDVLVITNSFPIWVAVLSWPVFGEKPTAGVMVAVLCGVVGVAATQKADFSQFQPAHFAAVFASVFTAIAMMGLNRLKGIPSLAVVVHFSAVSTVFCASSFFLFERTTGNVRLAEPLVLFKLLMVGATATVGQVFLTKAFKGGAATKVSVVGLSQVVMVMAWEIGDRRVRTGEWGLDWWKMLGTALVLGPTAYLMARERKRPPDKTPDDEPVVEEVAIE